MGAAVLSDSIRPGAQEEPGQRDRQRASKAGVLTDNKSFLGLSSLRSGSFEAMTTFCEGLLAMKRSNQQGQNALHFSVTGKYTHA